LSEILPSHGLGSTPDKVGKKSLKLLPKKTNTNQKIFFSSADKKTGWSVWTLEQFSSAIDGGAMALV